MKKHLLQFIFFIALLATGNGLSAQTKIKDGTVAGSALVAAIRIHLRLVLQIAHAYGKRYRFGADGRFGNSVG